VVAIRPITKQKFDDLPSARLQDELIGVVNTFKAMPFINGILHTDVVINTTIDLNHKLQRTIQGYIITKQNANTVIWQSKMDENKITLNSSANVTVNIWVF
jgi:hypothetical protein